MVWLALCGLLLGPGEALPAPAEHSATGRGIAADFRLCWTELQLAAGNTPYIVLDLGRNEVSLRLKGVTVWDCAVEFECPEQRLLDRLDPPVAWLTGKHLYTARERFPDSVLTVVASVAKVAPERLQRFEPGRFELRFGRDLILNVLTGAKASPRSRLGNLVADLRAALLDPITAAEITVRMEPDEALTLYCAAGTNTPVLIRGGG